MLHSPQEKDPEVQICLRTYKVLITHHTLCQPPTNPPMIGVDIVHLVMLLRPLLDIFSKLPKAMTKIDFGMGLQYLPLPPPSFLLNEI